MSVWLSIERSLHKVADLVAEGDLQGVPYVVGVFRKLRDLDRIAEHRRGKLAIEFGEKVGGALVERADHGLRRIAKVGDG